MSLVCNYVHTFIYKQETKKIFFSLSLRLLKLRSNISVTISLDIFFSLTAFTFYSLCVQDEQLQKNFYYIQLDLQDGDYFIKKFSEISLFQNFLHYYNFIDFNATPDSITKQFLRQCELLTFTTNTLHSTLSLEQFFFTNFDSSVK